MEWALQLGIQLGSATAGGRGGSEWLESFLSCADRRVVQEAEAANAPAAVTRVMNKADLNNENKVRIAGDEEEGCWRRRAAVGSWYCKGCGWGQGRERRNLVRRSEDG